MLKHLNILRWAIAAALAISSAIFVVSSIHWPLVGDASLMHYMAFLIHHGWVPYRDFPEMSFPGAYLVELAGIRLFGPNALGWRLFDFTLLAAAAAAIAVLTRRAGWFPAVFSAALFALIHGRDGFAQGGQRDLTMAVLLISSTACLFHAIRTRNALFTCGFGLFAGIACTIKPTALPLALAQLFIALCILRKPHHLLAATAGISVAPLLAILWLLHLQAIPAFWAILHGLIPYYITLGHKPLGFLLLHSISPLLPLVLLWFAVLALARPPLDWQRTLLLSGVAFGLLSYILQARGLPYYRYPLLAFLLPLMALDFTDAIHTRTPSPLSHQLATAFAVLALITGGLFLGPQSAILIHRYRWAQTDFNTSLTANLNRLGGHRLSGQVQCIDSISGCVTALYSLRLMPATHVFHDFPLFGQNGLPAVELARQQFRTAVIAHPPQVIILSSDLYVDGPGNYQKLNLWPELATFLAQNYQLDTNWTPTRTQRWWSREELGPSYRIYVRR